MLSLLIFLACPKQVGPSDAVALQLSSNPSSPTICVSSVAEAGPLKAELGAWDKGGKALRAGDTASARAAVAGGTHPALMSVSIGADLLDEDFDAARLKLIPLLDTYPEDGCLNQAAAWDYLNSGKENLARTHVSKALAADPASTNAHFLSASVSLQMGKVDEASSTLRTILQAEPDHVGANLLLGALYLMQGDELLALPLLEKAQEGGGDASAYLAPTYFGAGRIPEYLALASEAGWPLGDQGKLATSENVWADYLGLLGISEGAPLGVTLETSMGTISCELFYKEAPLTVANFVGLAQGSISWTDPKTNELMDGPLYDGTRFHRVISGFMVQGGDALSRHADEMDEWGSGSPGYTFPDEISPRLRFDRPGVLAMANAGPGTNGSQFFMTDGPAEFLNGRHTIFGQCDPVELVGDIAAVSKDARDRPLDPVTLHHVHIQR
ncbi:MAG: cyclophilin family peptidyl-prolyl cis-trans isomerase [Cognaticolwellia sp.]|jgi:cyclophilin family peptidyl-prolyl cis-trans isomerase